MKIDSDSTGDPGRHATLADLEKGFRSLADPPRDAGRVSLIVRKVQGGLRETPARIPVAPDSGLPGDAWGRKAERKADMQISVMQRDVAELIANGKFRARFGDDALRFVSNAELRPRNLRGIFMRVLQGGEVGPGDPVEVISRVTVRNIIREVKHGSPEHAATVELRDLVLRKPLGISFPPEELEAEKTFHHIACYRGEKLAGCLVLRPGINGEVQMKQVAVVPDLQRQGIGQAMVEYSEKFARDLGYRRMTLHARETAMVFYEKYGYAKIGDRFIQVTLPHWEMVKDLVTEKAGAGARSVT